VVFNQNKQNEQNNNNQNTPNEQKEHGKQKNEPIKQEKETCCGKKEEYEMKISELTSTLQRLQAEFENYQKRNHKQNAEFKEYANASLMEQLLPVLDALEQGVKHNKEFGLVNEQLISTLKKNGLEKIVVEEGKEFNHDKMECLMQEECEKICEGKVAKVLLSGYLLNGKVLRLAKVSISSGKKQKAVEEKKIEEKQGEKK